MTPQERDHELERLERLWALPSDATPVERALLYEPRCGPAHRHRYGIIRAWGRSVGLEPFEP